MDETIEYHVKFVKGNDIHPDEWGVFYSDDFTGEFMIDNESYQTKQVSIYQASKRAREQSLKDGFSRVIVEDKTGEKVKEIGFRDGEKL